MRCAIALVAVTGLLFVGCQIAVPVSVWSPAKLHSTVGQRMALQSIDGDKRLAPLIRERLVALAPDEPGRQLAFLSGDEFSTGSDIQLASASSDEANDVVLASIARRDGIEYLLRGEILSDRVASKEPLDRVRLSWRLMSLDANDRHRTAKHEGGDVVFMDTALAIKKFPDLQLLEDRDAILATAIARESYALWAPSVVSIDSILTVPYFTPGSKETRRGISLAQAGRWGDAASVWEQVIRAHPSQSAAVQNLAIAAVAQQDFSRAKQLIRSAIEFRDRECYRESLAWIELRQREYHRAFGLPDPPEGWFVTNRSD